MLNEKGEVCGRTFGSKLAMRAHQMKTKGGGHGKMKVAQVVPTNQCIFCRSIFKTKGSAKQHVARAMQGGKCKKDGAYRPTVLQEVPPPICRICGWKSGSLEAYYEHMSEKHLVMPRI